MSVIFGVAVLVTGAIWAQAQWGVWWEWREPTLVSFLIVFLLYCTYYPLRFAIPERERQARYASVFAITAGAFVPLNFLAVRLAEPLIHPRTFSSAGGLPGEMMFTFLVCLAGIALLWTTLVSFELAAKRTRADLGRLRRALAEAAVVPALPLDEAGKYVAAALRRLHRALARLRRDHGRAPWLASSGRSPTSPTGSRHAAATATRETSPAPDGERRSMGERIAP